MWRSPVQSMNDLKIVGKIGQGKTAEVFLAKDSLNNNYAVKRFWNIDGNHSASSEFDVFNDLGNHPRLPKIFLQDPQHLVMELSRNGELFDYISLRSPLFTEDLARHYFKQLVDVIDFIHTSGYAHRDIKPENILFDEHFNIKLTDFGFATIATPGDNLTTILGTDGYMAPELLKAYPYDPIKTDLFSLGVVLFCMVSGFPPYFENASEKDPYYRFFAERRTHMYWQCLQRKFNIVYSNEFMDLISGLLAYDPSERIDLETVKVHPFYTSEQKLTQDQIIKIMKSLRSQIEISRDEE